MTVTNKTVAHVTEKVTRIEATITSLMEFLDDRNKDTVIISTGGIEKTNPFPVPCAPVAQYFACLPELGNPPNIECAFREPKEFPVKVGSIMDTMAILRILIMDIREVLQSVPPDMPLPGAGF